MHQRSRSWTLLITRIYTPTISLKLSLLRPRQRWTDDAAKARAFHTSYELNEHFKVSYWSTVNNLRSYVISDQISLFYKLLFHSVDMLLPGNVSIGVLLIRLCGSYTTTYHSVIRNISVNHSRVLGSGLRSASTWSRSDNFFYTALSSYTLVIHVLTGSQLATLLLGAYDGEFWNLPVRGLAEFLWEVRTYFWPLVTDCMKLNRRSNN